MGSRGPLPKRTGTVRTARGVKIRPLPDEVDRIFARLAKDVDGLTSADVALIEDMARWVAIGKDAYRQLTDEGLLTTDTAHGNKEESRKNPLLIVLRTVSEQVRADALQLGATPLARARIPSNEPEQLSLADDLFAEAMAAQQNE